MILARADLINMFYFAHVSTRFSSKIICVVNRRGNCLPILRNCHERYRRTRAGGRLRESHMLADRNPRQMKYGVSIGSRRTNNTIAPAVIALNITIQPTMIVILIPRPAVLLWILVTNETLSRSIIDPL
jgi:hypothetical protein